MHNIKRLKSKTLFAISLICMLAIGTWMAVLPAVQAIDYPTWIIANAGPDPVGVGQPVYINAFMTKPNQGAAMGDAGTRYEGLSIVITSPNGNKETFGPKQADSTGGIFMAYYPTVTGNYTVQAFYPGQNITNTNKYLGSESSIITFTVQEDPISTSATNPLPTEYWSRPIYSTNFDWGSQLGSNWWGLGGPSFSLTGGYDAQGNVQPYGQAPKSSHILWTKPTSFGGQPGGEIASDQESQFTSSSIMIQHFNPIVVYGVLIYQEWPTTNNPSGIDKPLMWKAIDLKTGTTLWEKQRGITNNEDIIWGQVQKFHTIQEYGSFATFWSAGPAGTAGGTLYVYDAYTGAHLANVTNAPAAPMLGTRTGIVDSWNYNTLGSILRYYIDGGNLTCWNSTKLFTNRVSGQVDWSRGIEWTLNITQAYPQGTPASIGAVTVSDSTTGEGVILLRSAPTEIVYTSSGTQVTAGIELTTGKLLWGPLNQTIPQYQDITLVAARDGVYILHNKDTNEAYGYSLNNGKQLWGPVKLTGNAYSYLSRGAEIAYGQVYIWDFGGYVHALDLQTGKINWVFTRGSSGYDNPYGIWPIWHFGSQSIGDGMLFLAESRMYDPPMGPGYHRLAINCTTGDLVWKIQSFAGRAPGAIADGMLVQWNSYDKQLNVFGQGQTSTTISVANKLSVHGEKILVEGTVIDQSPGTKNADRVARFPNGVPAVSEDSQEAWMEYVYMQQNKPTDATGVTVALSVIDPNNNLYEVGTTTSDSNGAYAMTFTPSVPGQYTLIATFPGSVSYYGSSAETTFIVDEVAPTTSVIADPVSPPTELYFIVSTIAIILAIAIVGILLLRKKP
ncbi:MAG: PQQ-binding-like beta-propeller repeat protein [Nitrososphaerota archaeon]|jgi:hypothetical protein|nr:PQQ-binding-like beta-propeller repeat protein [Nitrososphaerota archaeon]